MPASLTATSSAPVAGGHTLHWFAECGRQGPGEGWERFLLQGVVRFGSVRVERAGGGPVPVEEFAAGTRRWWDAFGRGDPRLSADAQGLHRQPAQSHRAKQIRVPPGDDLATAAAIHFRMAQRPGRPTAHAVARLSSRVSVRPRSAGIPVLLSQSHGVCQCPH